MVIIHVLGALEGKVFARDGVEPGDDAMGLRGVKGGVVDEDGGGDRGGAESPLDLIPRLGAGRIVEECVGLSPRIQLG